MPTANVIASPTLLVCEPIAIRLRMRGGTMRTIGSAIAKPQADPDRSAAPTPVRFEESWNRRLERALNVDPAEVRQG